MIRKATVLKARSKVRIKTDMYNYQLKFQKFIFRDTGVSKHEDIVKRFRSRRSSRQIEDQKAQTNNDLDLKVDTSNVLSNGEFSNENVISVKVSALEIQA